MHLTVLITVRWIRIGQRFLRYAATDAWVGYLLHERISALTPLTKAQRAKAKAKAGRSGR